MTETRLVLIDDHPMVREGLRALIAPHGDLQICAEAATCEEALRVVNETHPDLALVDIQLKDGNGIDLVRQLRSKHDSLRMLVVSMHDEQLYAERALKAGALGYISKDESSRSLILAIRRVLEGKHYLSEAVNERILARTTSAGEKKGGNGISGLTDRELEVFELIGDGLTARDIASNLSIAVKTVNTFRENIKAKLSISSASKLTRVAIEWKLTGSGPE